MRYALMLAGLLLSGLAHAATVEFSLSWSEPDTGGPVDDYLVQCSDADGRIVLDVVTAGTSATGTALDVAEGTGSCSLTVRGPGGESEPVFTSWTLEITAPPGAPDMFRVEISCSADTGAVSCLAD